MIWKRKNFFFFGLKKDIVFILPNPIEFNPNINLDKKII